MTEFRRLLVGVAAAAVAAFGNASPAGAQAPTLEGETFEFVFFGTNPPNRAQLTPNCDPERTSTIRFDVGGVATGPYPGTFEATGTATIGPHTPSFVGFGHAGQVLTFEESFRIDSPNGEVRGTKTLRLPVPTEGTCFSVDELDEPPFFNQRGFQYVATAIVEYEATIRTPTGETFRDTGTSRVHVSEVRHCYSFNDPTGEPQSCGYGRNFNEEFLVSTGGFDDEPATVTLEPAAAVNPVGTSHTVTATVTNAAGEPLQGVTVEFTTTGAVTASGSCTTNASGQCTFTFRGPKFPGEVLIRGCAGDDGGEPCGTATKTFVLPVSTPGKTTGGGQILHVDGTGITFALEFQGDGGLKGECNVVDHPSGQSKVDCVEVLAYVQTANEATIYGNATIDGEPAGLFRIHVVDNGESGIGKDVFEIETQSGYVRAGVLTQGDIQIHRPA